jgi:hypothetical protein
VPWATSLTPELASDFKHLATALYNWWAEIFTWFDYGFTDT